LQVTSRQLRAFAECPAYYRFSVDTLRSSAPVRQWIVEDIVKKCCLQAVETGWKADWRRVVGWVDKKVFAGIEVDQEERFKEARLLAEHVLKSLQRWYKSYYLDMADDAYVDLDISYELQGQYVIKGWIPVVHLTNPVSISIVRAIDETERKMYNNLEIRTLAWLLDSHLHCHQVAVNALCIGSSGGFELKRFTVTREGIKRTETVIRQLVKSIEAGIAYPSRTEKCQKCPYFRRCIL